MIADIGAHFAYICGRILADFPNVSHETYQEDTRRTKKKCMSFPISI